MKRNFTILLALLALCISYPMRADIAASSNLSAPAVQVKELNTTLGVGKALQRLDYGLCKQRKAISQNDFKVGTMDVAAMHLEGETPDSYSWSFRAEPSASDKSTDYVLCIPDGGLYTSYNTSFAGSYVVLREDIYEDIFSVQYRSYLYPSSGTNAYFVNQEGDSIDIGYGYITFCPEQDGSYTLSWYVHIWFNGEDELVEGNRKIRNMIITDEYNRDMSEQIDNSKINALELTSLMKSIISSGTQATQERLFVKGRVVGNPAYSTVNQRLVLQMNNLSEKDTMICGGLTVNNPSVLPEENDWIIAYGTLLYDSIDYILTMQEGTFYQQLPDYRPTNLRVISGPGTMEFSWTADTRADYYLVRVYSGENDSIIKISQLTQNMSLSLITNSRVFEYYSKWEIIPVDHFFWFLEKESVGERFAVEANEYEPPTDLNASSEDGLNWTFTWKVPDKHMIDMTYVLVIERGNDVVAYDTVESKTTTFECTKLMLADQTYSWYVRAYSDNDKKWKTYAEGNDFEVSGVNKKTMPHNLNAITAGQTVILNWESTMSFFNVRWYSDDGVVIMDTIIGFNSEIAQRAWPLNLTHEALYSWSVVAMDRLSNGDFVPYFEVEGDPFRIGEDRMYSIRVTATEGGYIQPYKAECKRGELVYISAKPYPGYLFANWSDGSTDAVRYIPVYEDIVLEARFILDTKVYYTLTVNAADGGSVNNKTGRYEEGTIVSLIATPQSGYKLSFWSDGDEHVARFITMDKNYDLTAHFASTSITDSYYLNILAGEGGKVNDEINGSYLNESKLMVIAVPNIGYVFDRWNDNVTESVREVIIDGKDVNLMALFKQVSEFSLNVTSDNEEYGTVVRTIDGEEVSNGTYPEGTIVTITAVASEKCSFVKWSDDVTDVSRKIVLHDNVGLVAHFVQSQIPDYALNVSSNNSEYGRVVCTIDGVEVGNGNYKDGTIVTLTAVASEKCSFVKWSDDVTEASRRIVIHDNVDLVAYFVQSQIPYYTLDVSSNNSEYGHVICTIDGVEVGNGSYPEGTIVTLTAVAADGCSFEKWSDNVKEPSRRISLREDLKLVANFIQTQANNIIEQELAPSKIFRNGQILILRGDKTYTITGQEVK